MNNTNIDGLAREYTHLADLITQARERQAEIKDTLCEHVNDEARTGEHTIKVSRPKMFDDKAAAERFPLTTHPEMWTTRIDKTAVKNLLTPTQFDELTREGSPRLSITPRDA